MTPVGRARPALRSAPAAHPRLLGLGSYLPARTVPNADVVAAIGSSDAWVRERSGIEERRRAADGETVVDLAVAAGRSALEDWGGDPAGIDLVLVATITHPQPTPAAAPLVADRLGARGAGAADLGAACAGYCYGVALAADAVRSGSARAALVVGADRVGDLTDPADRGTAFLFGDGAGAVVVGPGESPGVGPVVWGSDGSRAQIITTVPPRPGDVSPLPARLAMDGPAVFRWAVPEVAGVCRRALAAAGVGADDLAAFVPHQANGRITAALVRALALPAGVAVADDVRTSGNTSAASVPLALDRLRADGRVSPGDLALQVGFGAGLVFAAQVVAVP